MIPKFEDWCCTEKIKVKHRAENLLGDLVLLSHEILKTAITEVHEEAILR